MRAVIAVTYFDTPENNRARSTARTFATLRGQIEPPHLIVAVDNGSTDKYALHDVAEIADTMIVFDEPHSIAYGVNFAWHLYEDEILRGDMVAIKHDSDLNVIGNDWLNVAFEIIKDNPDMALLGPKHSRIDYSDWDLQSHERWFESKFLHGGVAIRTPVGFKTIGYAWQPHGRWGWQDHYDCRRITENTDLKIGLMKDYKFAQHIGHSALSREDKEGMRAKGKSNLVERLGAIRDSKHPLYQDFTP